MGLITGTVYCSLLILTVVSHLSEGRKKRFSCTFNNDRYALPAQNIFDGVFGDSVPAHKYEDVTDLNDDLGYISEAIGEAMASKLHSNVEDLIIFHKTYEKKKRTKSMEEIFNEYHIKVDQPYTDLTFLVDIFDRLARLLSTTRKRTEKSSFIVTADGTAGLNEVGNIVHYINPKSLNHERIAGAVKFILDNRQGLILIDPFATYRYLGVVMTDGGPLPNGLILPGRRLQYQYRMPNSDFIFASNNERNMTILYYVAQPFCSMLDCTIKTNILDLAGYIEVMNVTGGNLAELNFLFDASQNHQVIELESREFPRGARIILNEGESLKDSAEKDNHTSNVYNTFINLLQARDEESETTLNYIRKIGLDTDFIEKVNILRNSLVERKTKMLSGAIASGQATAGSTHPPTSLVNFMGWHNQGASSSQNDFIVLDIDDYDDDDQ